MLKSTANTRNRETENPTEADNPSSLPPSCNTPPPPPDTPPRSTRLLRNERFGRSLANYRLFPHSITITWQNRRRLPASASSQQPCPLRPARGQWARRTCVTSEAASTYYRTGRQPLFYGLEGDRRFRLYYCYSPSSGTLLS